MSYDSEVLADSPWVYYSTTEASGTITDDSGNGRDLTLPGGSPTYAQPGPIGAADAMLWPDSSGATEYYATSTTLGSVQTALTPECWFYYSGTPPTNPTALCGIAYGYGNSSERPAICYLGTDGKVNYWWGSTGTSGAKITSASALSAGWYHIACPTTSTAAKIRLNKVDVASGSHATSIASTGFFFVHGGGNLAAYANLTNSSALVISKPAMYLSTLSDARIDAHYDAMGSSTVVVPVATATAAGVVPVVSADSTVAAPAASASAAGLVPAVAGSGDAAVVVPMATATGAALAPSVAATASVDAPTAAASAAGLVPVVAATSSSTVVAPVATAVAAGIAPFVFNGSPDAFVTVPAAAAVASAPAPGLGVGLGSDVSNVFDGRQRGGFATVVVTVPVVAPIGVATTRVDKAVPLPLPVLVKGRPT